MNITLCITLLCISVRIGPYRFCLQTRQSGFDTLVLHHTSQKHFLNYCHFTCAGTCQSLEASGQVILKDTRQATWVCAMLMPTNIQNYRDGTSIHGGWEKHLDGKQTKRSGETTFMLLIHLISFLDPHTWPLPTNETVTGRHLTYSKCNEKRQHIETTVNGSGSTLMYTVVLSYHPKKSFV